MKPVKNKRKTRGKLTRSHLIKEYLDLKAELGRKPTYAEYAKRRRSISTLRNVFRKPGWSSLLKAADEKPKAALIQAYRALRKKLRRQPRCNEYCRKCHSRGAITAVFGRSGWRNLARAAGDKPLMAFNKPFIDRDLTADHLIKDFLDLQEKLRRRPKLRSISVNSACAPGK